MFKLSTAIFICLTTFLNSVVPEPKLELNKREEDTVLPYLLFSNPNSLDMLLFYSSKDYPFSPSPVCKEGFQVRMSYLLGSRTESDQNKLTIIQAFKRLVNFCPLDNSLQTFFVKILFTNIKGARVQAKFILKKLFKGEGDNSRAFYGILELQGTYSEVQLETSDDIKNLQNILTIIDMASGKLPYPDDYNEIFDKSEFPQSEETEEELTTSKESTQEETTKEETKEETSKEKTKEEPSKEKTKEETSKEKTREETSKESTQEETKEEASKEETKEEASKEESKEENEDRVIEAPEAIKKWKKERKEDNSLWGSKHERRVERKIENKDDRQLREEDVKEIEDSSI